ncbi:glycosyltransferase family 2 protein [Campylobacterota bacterium]
MKFSIVTPTFNHKEYIDTTIKSVLKNKKDYPNVEYIVVDGDSNDGTQDVVRSYGNEIDLFISEPDDGQSDAINKGFSHATGEIYAYINSDDYYYPDTFVKVAKIFEENPGIDVIYGNCLFVTEDEQFLRYFTEVEPYDEYRLRSCTDFIMQPTCFWRKEIYDICGGFTKDFHFGFDWEFWSRMAKKGANFFYLNELLAVNREFEETKTSRGGEKRLQELKQINMLHMQSLLPYAYYSYSAAEYRSNPPERKIMEKIVWRLKAYFYRLFSITNIFYYYKNYGNNNLYGLRHHKNILEQDALVSIPYYKDDKNPLLVITLYSHLNNQTVKVNINGDIIKSESFKNNHKVILYRLPDVESSKIDISFHFSQELIKAHGRKQKILGKTSKYSANLLMCQVITSDGLENFSIASEG